VTKINPQKIYGNFVSGWALDVHTLSSTYLGVNDNGHEVYDTTRSEVGDLLYRLKYRFDRDAGNEIARVAAAYIARTKTKFDVLVPVPPSGARALQPVIFLANAIGAAVPLMVADCVTTIRATEPLKGVTDKARRKELLAGLHAIDANQTEGRHILLLDDLFRSGSTLNAITDVLTGEGKAASVRVLTITKTRSNS
jgi:predicted amidophosphoribosyltransferase